MSSRSRNKLRRPRAPGRSSRQRWRSIMRCRVGACLGLRIGCCCSCGGFGSSSRGCSGFLQSLWHSGFGPDLCPSSNCRFCVFVPVISLLYRPIVCLSSSSRPISISGSNARKHFVDSSELLTPAHFGDATIYRRWSCRYSCCPVHVSRCYNGRPRWHV
jgi:hypothetical protein